MVRGPNEGHGEASSDAARALHRAISHNLRTPLAVIKGCTDMLIAHGDEELDEERRRELLTTTAANVDLLADAIVWLEERIDALAEGGVIRLPDDDEAVPPQAPPAPLEPRL
jgi:signal transduction histidine kinase